jgi:hypothetical protein
MKKIICILVLMFTLTLLPYNTVKAATGMEEQNPKAMSLIKQKRQTINAEIKKHNKLHKQINKESSILDELLSTLSKDNVLLSETKLAQLEDKENDITKITRQLIQVDKKIEALNIEITDHMHHKSHEEVLASFDELISLVEKKTKLLKLHYESLESYVEFVKSLDYK